MMARLRIVQEGYVRGSGARYRASSACVLIEDAGRTIVVDPGSNPTVIPLIDRCDVVYLTHSHIDHYLNAPLIPHGAIMDRFYTFTDDMLEEHDLVIPGTSIELLPTPGHSVDHSSLLVGTDAGTVLVAGDLFWWPDDARPPEAIEDLIGLPDPFATDREALISSRRTALEGADLIVPGHGRTMDIRALR